MMLASQSVMTTGETTAYPVKVPQPHGGALNSGGTPGNRGGKGAVASKVRSDCVGDFDRLKKIAAELIDDPATSAADKLRALDIIGKYGLGQKVEIQVGPQLMRTVGEVGAEFFKDLIPRETFEAFLAKLETALNDL